MRGVTLLLVVLLAGLCAPRAHAQTNVTLGDITAKSVKFKARAAPSVANNQCVLYFDATSGVLTASCKNSSGTGFATVVVGTGCSADATGNLSCNSFISANQNLLASPAINRLRLFDNTVDLTPNPTCANYGQTGILSVFDTDESSGTARYSLCAGAILLDDLGALTHVVRPFGFLNGTAVTVPADDDDCKCYLFNQDVAMAAIDKLSLSVTTLDADDTLKAGIYNYTGTRQYYEAPIVVTSAAVVTTANALKLCVGGANQDVSCAASSECPGGACSTTAPPFPRGDYWLCFGQNVVTASVIVLASVNGGASSYGANFTSVNGCVAGDLPNTLAITPTFGAMIPPYFALSDE